MKSYLTKPREETMTSMERKVLVSISINLNLLIDQTSGSTGGSFRGGNFGNDFYSFERAEDIFKNFFGGKDPFEDFFDDNDEFFSFGFNGMGPKRKSNNANNNQR